MSKRTGKKPRKPKKPPEPFDPRVEARKHLRSIFKRDLAIAKSDSQTVVAGKAREKLYELAGLEDVPADYVVDFKLIEITQDDQGRIVQTAAWVFIPTDNRLPLQGNKKLLDQIEPK